MALTIKQVARITAPGRYGDGKNLYLQVSPTGTKAWLFRFQHGGRNRGMGLGSVDTFTLDEAREMARLARQQLHAGIDPLIARQAQRTQQLADTAAAAAKNVSFREAAEQHHAFHSPKWSVKHAKDFMATLRTFAFPTLGKLPVAAIDKALVLKVLTPVWHSKTVTASRVRNRIETVLDFAKVSGYRDGDNPAAWTANLEHALPAPAEITEVEHFVALPFLEMPGFMAKLAAVPGIPARALEMAILTSARSNEIIKADWREFDLVARMWVIPGKRTKTRKEHRVPLSNEAVAILQALPREANLVFPGEVKNSHIGKLAMSRTLSRIVPPSIATVHGFRSSFRDWAGERTSYPNHVLEMALAHKVSSAVEAAYRRKDLYDQRVHLMQDWANFCNRPQADATVTPIRRARVK